MASPANRRKYPRLAAPIYYRPAGPEFMHHRRATVNMSPGGMRVYSDEAMPVGTRLEVELLLSEEASLRCWVRVAWTEELPATAQAAYDIGLEFTDMTDEDRRVLTEKLEAG